MAARPKVDVAAAAWEELKLGNVYECSIRDPEDREQVHGVQVGTRVYVDPRLGTIDTLCHELLHRRFPRWGERRVRLETLRLIKRMTDADKRRWWRAYQRVKRASRPLDVEDE